MVWVANEEDTSDRIEGSASQARQRIHSSGSTLRVALKDEAFGWVAAEAGLDAVDDLEGVLVSGDIAYGSICQLNHDNGSSATYISSARGRVLASTSRVDGVVLSSVRRMSDNFNEEITMVPPET